MKRLLFLLLVMVLGAGMVFATAGHIHPPGVITLEAALSGYGVDGYVVSPDTVLVTEMPLMADLSSIYDAHALQALLANDNFIAIQSQSGFILCSHLINNELASAVVDYYLRC
jgi:hypothetical protein